MDAGKLFGTTDLYKILEIDSAATINEGIIDKQWFLNILIKWILFSVKKSYYRLARIHHPDKSDIGGKSTAATKFNIIHQAYIILSNPETRLKYDSEGPNVLFARATIAGEWENYLRTTTTDDFKDASALYKDSNSEKVDILREFVSGNGSMIHLLNNIPFMRKGDEIRITKIVQNAIEAKEIPRIAIKKLPKGY